MAEGFRLLQMDAFQERGRTPVHLYSDPPMQDPMGYLHREFTALKGTTFSRYPTYNKAPLQEREGAQGEPVMRVENVERDGRQLLVEVSYGKLGAHENLIDPSPQGSEVEIGKWVATNRLRVVVFFPRRGVNIPRLLVAGEVRGRSHVTEAVFALLNVESWRAHGVDSDRGPDAPWVRFRPAKIVDPSRIEEILKSEIVGLALTRKTLKHDGRIVTRGAHLTQSGLAPEHLAAAAHVVSRWIEGKSGRGDISAFVEMVDGDLEDIGFDDGKFVFNPDGRETTIGPANLDRFLTYPIEVDHVDFEVLRSAALERIAKLSELLGFPVDS